MTGVRQSFVFALEDRFGKGKGSGPWLRPPPGTFMNFTHSRGVEVLYEAGSKYWDSAVYGTVQGSFEWTFNMDYKHMEPFLFVFEDYKHTFDAKTGRHIHEFSKANYKRVPPFTVRQKILNRIAGGPEHSDETTERYGCVVKNCRIQSSAGSSKVAVTFTGFYADEQMVTNDLDATDYDDTENALVEFQCAFFGDNLDCTDYFTNVESLGLSIENNASATYSTCTPIAKAFSEGQTNNTMSISLYSNNPELLKKRLYTGGKIDNSVTRPRSRNMAPMDKVTIVSYSNSMRDDGYASVAECMENSMNSVRFDIYKWVIKSMTWQKGDGSKLMDTISNSEFQKVKMTIVNDCDDLLSANNINAVR